MISSKLFHLDLNLEPPLVQCNIVNLPGVSTYLEPPLLLDLASA